MLRFFYEIIFMSLLRTILNVFLKNHLLIERYIFEFWTNHA
jgi:hypothetical protein